MSLALSSNLQVRFYIIHCCWKYLFLKLVDSLPPMTLKQLSEYDGKKNSKVYLACKGIVFDVSKSGNWFKED